MKPPYEISQRILQLYGEIGGSLGICRSLRLSRPDATLRKRNRIKTIHSSLAIEGNALTPDQVTALLEQHRVAGPAKDILEVQNAIHAYNQLADLDPLSPVDFLKAHHVLMNGLVASAGKWRSQSVGVWQGAELQHLAPAPERVPGLMEDLFTYLRQDTDLDLIKSCVFHYEAEFIHPFEDGNGRMGRLWRTRLLMRVDPIFEFVPVEEVVRQHQEVYHHALAEADHAGQSTGFIEFMLEAIHHALRDTMLVAAPGSGDFQHRADHALARLYVIYPGSKRHALGERMEALPLEGLATRELAAAL
jgi:Fic family protein